MPQRELQSHPAIKELEDIARKSAVDFVDNEERWSGVTKKDKKKWKRKGARISQVKETFLIELLSEKYITFYDANIAMSSSTGSAHGPVAPDVPETPPANPPAQPNTGTDTDRNRESVTPAAPPDAPEDDDAILPATPPHAPNPTGYTPGWVADLEFQAHHQKEQLSELQMKCADLEKELVTNRCDEKVAHYALQHLNGMRAISLVTDTSPQMAPHSGKGPDVVANNDDDDAGGRQASMRQYVVECRPLIDDSGPSSDNDVADDVDGLTSEAQYRTPVRDGDEDVEMSSPCKRRRTTATTFSKPVTFVLSVPVPDPYVDPFQLSAATHQPSDKTNPTLMP